MMSTTPWFEPYGARLLSIAEVGDLLSQLIATHDQGHEMGIKLDVRLDQRHEREARQLRELRWLLDANDKVWLLVEPPNDPEFIQGSVYLVVIRHGKLLVKQRLVAA